MNIQFSILRLIQIWTLSELRYTKLMVSTPKMMYSKSKNSYH